MAIYTAPYKQLLQSKFTTMQIINPHIIIKRRYMTTSMYHQEELETIAR